MTWLRVLRARLFALVHKAQLETELEEELRFHLQMRAQENVRRGMSEPEASLAAQRQFGNVNIIKDAWRDVAGGGLIEAFGKDLRFAWRMLRRDQGFAVIAVLALGLGIGANTALFTVVSNVLLRPLPYPAPQEIMSISFLEDGNASRPLPFSYPDFADLQPENQWFSGLGAFSSTSFVVSGGHAGASHASGARVTPDALRLLGTEPALGRLFLDKENEAGSRSVVISHDLWQQRFQGALTVIGETLTLDGQDHTVVGVMPADFQFPVTNEPSEVWTTFARDREPFSPDTDILANHRDAHYVQVLGRLRAGVKREDAATGVSEVAARLAEMYPLTNRHLYSCSITPWLEQITKKVRPALLVLIGATLCVLGVACANVANLLLARASTRQKEIAVRAALGAGRGRLLRQLLAESLLLSILGGCLGLLIALVGTHNIVALLPPDFPRSAAISPNLEVLVFAGLVTVATSCLFGFAPAWYAARCPLARVLNDCSRTPGTTPRGRRARNALVVAELVLAFVLLAGAWTLMRRFWTLENAPLGFDPRNLLTAKVSVPESGDDGPIRVGAFFGSLMERLGNSPAISSAAAIYPWPFTDRLFADYEIEGRPIAKSDLPRARTYSVTANYFRTMGIPLKQGRAFDSRDRRDAPQTAIISEALARSAFPNENPLGKRIRPGVIDGGGAPPEREIVGIVGDINSEDAGVAPKPTVYLPHPQCAASDMCVVIKVNGSTDSIVSTLEYVIYGINERAPVYQPHPLEHYLAATIAQVRLSSILMTIFAIVALVLTGIGVYGVMAYSVTHRRHEIGIRLALGAQKIAVFRLIVGEGLRVIACSVICGALCAFAATRFLERVIDGGNDGVVVTIVLVGGLLAFVALLACWVPAQRAAGMDPLAAIGQR
jgi:putative ABC transport system permease protein